MLMKTPVLLVGFNRPQIISQSFKCVAEQKPEKIFIAIDGPRTGISSDVNLVNQVKTIVTNISWPCQVKYLFNDQNMGAELTISNAVSWVLKEEDAVIIVEDDIIASTSFFQFSEEMLEKYKDNEKIYMISGGQFTPMQLPNDEDYLFAIHGHTGTGWATWRRAWYHFSLYVDVEALNIKRRELRAMSSNKAQEFYLENMIIHMKERGVGNSSWDCCWLFIRYYNHGLTIVPKVNLTTNIGTFGLHANGRTIHHYRPYDKEFTASIHPDDVAQNKKYDAFHSRIHLFRNNVLVAIFKRTKIYQYLRILKHRKRDRNK